MQQTVGEAREAVHERLDLANDDLIPSYFCLQVPLDSSRDRAPVDQMCGAVTRKACPPHMEVWDERKIFTSLPPRIGMRAGCV